MEEYPMTNNRIIDTPYGTFEVAKAPEIEIKGGKLKLPVMTPIIVPVESVIANSYNPNHVDPQNMDLLKTSILDNGFTFAIVTIWDDEQEKFVIIDGFHRYLILKEVLKCKEIPIVVLEHNMMKRMSATVQFNRARGVHQVELMGDLVKSMFDQGADDEEIAHMLGMELEEVFRLKQITGIAYLFRNQAYSKSWEVREVDANV